MDVRIVIERGERCGERWGQVYTIHYEVSGVGFDAEIMNDKWM
jgi:hypothetical protein